VVAAAVLKIVTGEALFIAAALAFAGSVTALLLTRFPARTEVSSKGPFFKRALRGVWIYGRTPRLRGLFLLNFALSVVMAWVLVNSVVYAGARLGDAERFYPMLMAFYGVGAGCAAVVMPRLLRRISERRAMVSGVFSFAVVGGVFATVPTPAFAVMAMVWIAFGAASSLVLTPGGLVITRSASRSDRAAVFAAQFSLSHAGWLVAYPVAGVLAETFTLEVALLILAVTSAIIALVALRVWPAHDPLERPHSHPELPDDHPHLHSVPATGAQHRHIHVYQIDDVHPVWGHGT
jgi:MFS family permease